MRSLARWGSLLVMAAPLDAWALGLGEIEGNSYLNQPLDAEIPLTATQQELDGLSVAMAAPSIFAAEGLEYPALLNSIEFTVGRNARGQNVIRVESAERIIDPFVTILVEVQSGRSTMYREFTVLLDPPTFLADEAPAAPIAAPATRAPAPAATSGGQIARQPAAPAGQAQAQPLPPPAPRATAAPSASAADSDYTVQAGDTLWRIAEGVRPAGVTNNQAMISIFEANPGAFDGNINRLRRGAILRIPPTQGLGAVGAAAATAEVRRQNEAWQAGGQAEPRLVLIAPSDDAEAGSAAAGAAASAHLASLQNEVSDLASELESTRAQLAEAERLLQIRDAELAEVQNLAQESADAATEGEVPAEDDAVFVDDGSDAAELAAAEPVVEEPVAATPPPVTTPSVSTQSSSPSLMDQAIAFLSNRIVLGAAGVLVLLIGALAFLRRRRDDDVDDVTGQWEALEAELDDEADQAKARIQQASRESDMVVVEGRDGTGTIQEPMLGTDFDPESTDTFDDGSADEAPRGSGTMELSQPEFLDDDDEPAAAVEAEPAHVEQTLSSQTVINLDHDDPIAEADFHMAYGLYDQAAELIGKALDSDPGNRSLKLKLLEVFFVWGNKESFLEQAQGLRAELGSGASADWDKVVIMGKQICPDEPLFAEATSAAGSIDLDLEASGSSAGLDFTFEDPDDKEIDLDLAIDDDVDLEIETSGVRDARVEITSQNETLELGERTQAGLEAALLEDFDDDEEGDTIEHAELEDDSTVESPTLETPTVEAGGPASYEPGDTVEQPRPAESHAAPESSSDMTAEIELDDLGLDLGDLGDIPDIASDDNDDTGSIEFVLDDSDDDPDDEESEDSTLSATGVTQVLNVDDDDLTQTGTAVLDPDRMIDDESDTGLFNMGTSTEVLEQPVSGFEPEPPETDDDLDLNLDDFSSALGGGDTVEQPRASGFESLDMDVGADVPADDEPTGTESYSPLDPQTMTEVGTKLDLARAYIDMGDPEGARSILEEVLSEGDAGQRSEAQSLIDALPA
jgi:pilus assembly protein FimV